MEKKTVVLYVTHELNFNFHFFRIHGIVDSPQIDFYLILNGVRMTQDIANQLPSNVFILERANSGIDFGGWSQCLLQYIPDRSLYNYFIFINNTARGPFLPPYLKSESWVQWMTQQITEEIKLFGATITFLIEPHVQSYCFVTDSMGLKILIDQGIFCDPKDFCHWSKNEMILKKEVLMSKVMLSNGYNIGCFLKIFYGRDFRQPAGVPKKFRKDFLHPRVYIGNSDVHPYETMFLKSNRLLYSLDQTTLIYHTVKPI